MRLFQAGPAVEELPPPPPPPAEPPVESAWERGLRHAKEVLTCAFPRGFSSDFYLHTYCLAQGNVLHAHSLLFRKQDTSVSFLISVFVYKKKAQTR